MLAQTCNSIGADILPQIKTSSSSVGRGHRKSSNSGSAQEDGREQITSFFGSRSSPHQESTFSRKISNDCDDRCSSITSGSGTEENKKSSFSFKPYEIPSEEGKEGKKRSDSRLDVAPELMDQQGHGFDVITGDKSSISRATTSSSSWKKVSLSSKSSLSSSPTINNVETSSRPEAVSSKSTHGTHNFCHKFSDRQTGTHNHNHFKESSSFTNPTHSPSNSLSSSSNRRTSKFPSANGSPNPTDLAEAMATRDKNGYQGSFARTNSFGHNNCYDQHLSKPRSKDNHNIGLYFSENEKPHISSDGGPAGTAFQTTSYPHLQSDLFKSPAHLSNLSSHLNATGGSSPPRLKPGASTVSGGHHLGTTPASFGASCRDMFCKRSCFLSSGLPSCPAGCINCSLSSLASTGLPPSGSQMVGVLPPTNICSWMIGNTFCGKRFTSPEELLQHLKTHTNSAISANPSATFPPSMSPFGMYGFFVHPSSTPLSRTANLEQYYNQMSNRFHPYKQLAAAPNMNLLNQFRYPVTSQHHALMSMYSNGTMKLPGHLFDP